MCDTGFTYSIADKACTQMQKKYLGAQGRMDKSQNRMTYLLTPINTVLRIVLLSVVFVMAMQYYSAHGGRPTLIILNALAQQRIAMGEIRSWNL
jgi:hypothetical protein